MNKRRAPALRIVVYPGAGPARMFAHALATAVGLGFAFRLGSVAVWWTLGFWYLVAFVGTHVAFVPIMTGWRLFLEAADRYVRGIVEEELLRFDLQNYERQLARLMSPDGRPG